MFLLGPTEGCVVTDTYAHFTDDYISFLKGFFPFFVQVSSLVFYLVSFFIFTSVLLFVKNLIQGGRIMVHQIIDVSIATLSFGIRRELMVPVAYAECRPRPTLSAVKVEKFIYRRLEKSQTS